MSSKVVVNINISTFIAYLFSLFVCLLTILWIYDLWSPTQIHSYRRCEGRASWSPHSTVCHQHRPSATFDRNLTVCESCNSTVRCHLYQCWTDSNDWSSNRSLWILQRSECACLRFGRGHILPNKSSLYSPWFSSWVSPSAIVAECHTFQSDWCAGHHWSLPQRRAPNCQTRLSCGSFVECWDWPPVSKYRCQRRTLHTCS